MNIELYNLGQQQRPESERNLSEWERAALDRHRSDEHMNRAENPAIWSKLMMIEAKMDQILALLQSKSQSQHQNPRPQQQKQEIVADIP